MQKIQMSLDKIYKLKENQTTVRTEIMAGISTFLMMAYIILINPAILHTTGMDMGAVFVATCCSIGIGSFLIGLLANYPIAIAPSMALNVYFAYVIVHNYGYSWQVGLGMVFLAGILFFLITLTKLRLVILKAIPNSLNIAIASGIGLFLVLIALKNGGIIVANSNTLLSLGKINTLPSLLFFFGFLLIIYLDYKQIKGAIIIGIISVTILSLVLGVNKYQGLFSLPPSLGPTFLHLQIAPLLHPHAIFLVFTLFLVALFDCTGTLIGLLQETTLLQKQDKFKRLSRAFLAESISTISGSLLGTSTTSPYVESAAGIHIGGRTGLTTTIVALLFLCCIFLAPLAKTVPVYATAPALFYVGCLLFKNVSKIDWSDVTELIPAAITIIMIPFSFSIADGIGLGFISYVIVKAICGKTEYLNWMLVILSLLFIAYFVL